LYANPAFLRWSGHESLDRLIAAGGLEELFIEPIAAAGAGDRKPLTLSIDRGNKASIAGELTDIRWNGEPAHALIISAPEASSEKREQAQAELAELKSILDTATDGVILLDAQGRILSGNRSAEALFGYDELAGRAFAELFAPESAEVAQHYLD